MHLENGEIKHDGSIEDQKFYLKALEAGITPGFPSYGREIDLTAAFPEGYFEGQLEESDAVLRGLAKIALSQSRFKIEAVSHLIKFVDEARIQSTTAETSTIS